MPVISTTRRVAVAVVAAAVLTALVGCGGDGSGTGAEPGAAAEPAPRMTADLRRRIPEIRLATRRYRDVAAAMADGYVQSGGCALDPDAGGMGIRFVNPALVEDGAIDAVRPESLVYHFGRGGLRLGALEYLALDADQDAATDDDRPNLHGVAFSGPVAGNEADARSHYQLHLWLYRDNPSGVLATFNPNVRCPRPRGGAG
jgi:hypothetical protein